MILQKTERQETAQDDSYGAIKRQNKRVRKKRFLYQLTSIKKTPRATSYGPRFLLLRVIAEIRWRRVENISRALYEGTVRCTRLRNSYEYGTVLEAQGILRYGPERVDLTVARRIYTGGLYDFCGLSRCPTMRTILHKI